MGESSDNFRTTDIWRRPQTQELVDVHVYVVPSDKWIEQRKLAKRDIIDHAISSGFVRVLPSTTLLELRSEINEQLGTENVPDTYVFLRNVGRNFTQVKSKQELELKIKSFLPPYAEEPEVYVKEGSYTLIRSASVGADLVRSCLSSQQNTANSSEDTRCSCEDTRSTTSSIGTNSSAAGGKRALSLDRRGIRTSMASIRAAAPRQLTPKRHSRPRNTRPPTPRVTEKLFVKSNKHRSLPVSSTKATEAIRESPSELIEEERVSKETLIVETPVDLVANSPPPRPASQPERETKEMKLPVPTTTTQVEKLQKQIEDLRAQKRIRELKRDSLMQKVRDLQRRKASTKDQAREEWRKRFLEVRKSTPRLEDYCAKLRQELEKLVKDMLVSVKSDPDSKPHKPSKKTSYKIMIMRLLQEVEDLRRRLQSVAVRLNAETKLRAQAEFEVKRLRQDLLHKKTQVTLTRKQASFPQTSEQFFISAV